MFQWCSVSRLFAVKLSVSDVIGKMASQKKISSFFSPMSLKRGQAENSPDAKRQKRCLSTSNSEFTVGDEEENTSSKENRESEANIVEDLKKQDSAAALSPQQKQVISSNKLKAEMKKAGRTSGGLVINIGSCWFTALQKEFTKPYFQQLSQFVCDERKKKTIYPPSEHVFSFTQRCPINKVKVVILGQDPYHGPNQAHGLCFSVQKGISPPPSLQNMYKELETDVCGFKHPGHGDLTGWAQQGVLLLNAVLTVQAHNANSHKDRGWEKFTDAVITYINDNLRGVLFILWGAYAQKKGARIDKKKHHVLKGVHPSPLSAHRGYFGCKHFSQCNQLLEKSGKSPIDWTRLP